MTSPPRGGRGGGDARDARDAHNNGDDDVEVRRVQPYEARKAYLCPGCNHAIPAGVGHLVVVPRDAPDLRRHWHHPCWAERGRRRPGRSRPRSGGSAP